MIQCLPLHALAPFMDLLHELVQTPNFTSRNLPKSHNLCFRSPNLTRSTSVRELDRPTSKSVPLRSLTEKKIGSDIVQAKAVGALSTKKARMTSRNRQSPSKPKTPVLRLNSPQLAPRRSSRRSIASEDLLRTSSP